MALLSCVGLLTVAKPRAHCGEGDSNASGGDSSRAGGAGSDFLITFSPFPTINTFLGLRSKEG